MPCVKISAHNKGSPGEQKYLQSYPAVSLIALVVLTLSSNQSRERGRALAAISIYRGSLTRPGGQQHLSAQFTWLVNPETAGKPCQLWTSLPVSPVSPLGLAITLVLNPCGTYFPNLRIMLHTFLKWRRLQYVQMQWRHWEQQCSSGLLPPCLYLILLSIKADHYRCSPMRGLCWSVLTPDCIDLACSCTQAFLATYRF